MPFLLLPVAVQAPALPAPMLIDFRIGATSPSGPAPLRPEDAVGLTPQSGMAPDPPTEPPEPAPPHPRFSQAQGFGTQIPLGFATSQIVPHRVKVTFGPGVEPESPVSWTGGRPWNQVLATAVAPLGYRIQTGRMSVAVLRKD